MKHLRFLLLLLGIIFLAPKAGAKTVYVNQNATGTVHDGTSWATACLTVQDAVFVAADSDEIWVAKGSYGELITIEKSLSLYGGFAGTETAKDQRNWHANIAVLDGGVDCAALSVVLDGFTVRNGLYNVAVLAGGATLLNNTITGNVESGVTIWEEASATLLDNVIYGNTHYGLDNRGRVAMAGNTFSGNLQGGVYVIGPATLTGYSNNICGNGGFGVQITFNGQASLANNTIAGNGGHGIDVASGSVALVNNTITGNGYAFTDAAGVHLGINWEWRDATAWFGNNVIAFNTGYGVRLEENGKVPVFSHNDVYLNTDGSTFGFTPAAGQGNIEVDPKLSSVYQNAHLQPGSPCIDAGDDAVVEGTGDIDWQARTQGAHVDIGSDESDGKTWPTASRTYFVSASGSDANDGTSWARAKRSVASALIATRSTDEVWVARGIYPELVVPPADVFLYGGFAGTETARAQRNWRANATVLDGSARLPRPALESFSPNVTVDGFHVRNGSNGAVVIGPATLSHNAIYGNGASGVYVASGPVSLVNNAIYNNAEDGVSITDGPVTLTGNTISGNGLSGVDTTGLLPGNGTASLVNNTISGNGQEGVNAGLMIDLTNNILAFNGGHGFSKDTYSDVMAFARNDVYGNVEGEYVYFTPPAGQGNLSVDPKLSYIYQNVHIQPGSPCIDAGDDSKVNAGDTDIDGQPRIRGAHADIGSDESDGTVWVNPPPTIWHVSTGGNDSADGASWATALRNITTALRAAQAGDEVWVERGTYAEYGIEPPLAVSIYGGFAGTETQRAQRDWRANTTALDGYSPGPVVTCRLPATVIDGFSILNGSNEGLLSSSRPSTFTNLTIANNSLAGLHISGSATVTSCTISQNGNEGVVLDRGCSVTLANNRVTGNGDSGFSISGTANLVNNTITANGGNGLSISGTVTLANNLVAFNSIYGLMFSYDEFFPGAISAFSYNDFFGNLAGDYTGFTPSGGQGNLAVDPKLSHIHRNVHLQPGSPCIDAGNNAAVTGNVDIDGEPRTQGAHVDIGADESDGTVWPTTPRILRVSPKGDDNNDGQTWATAKKTVDAAMYAEGTDEVWVAAGTYNKFVRIPVGVALYGGFAGMETARGQRNWRANATVLDGNKSDIVLCWGYGTSMDGFTIRGRYYLLSGSATIQNNTFTGSSNNALYVLGAATIRSNVIADCSGTGLYIESPSVVAVANNTIVGNQYGVSIYRSAFTPNSIHTFHNNIIAFSRNVGFTKGSGETLTAFARNDVFGNTIGNYGSYMPPSDQGNLVVDPKFVDRANKNYNLQAGSPCIDVGDDAMVPPGSTDIDGRPRIQGAHVDIGACEYSTAALPFAVADVAKCLSIVSGRSAGAPDDLSRLNVETANPGLDIRDAVRIVRKVAGLEPNP